MRKAKLQAATLGGNPDDIEAAFYDALRQGDIERLMACWADEEEIVCVHPGGRGACVSTTLTIVNPIRAVWGSSAST